MSKFVHYELNTSDPKAAKKFYAKVFGWKYEDMPMPNGVYTMINTPDGPLGGIQQNPMPDAPSHWLGYAMTDSVEKTNKKVEKGGGKVLVPKVVIPNIGELAVYADPTGAVFAVWKELAKPKAAASTKKKSTKKAKKAGAKKSAKKATKKTGAKKSAKKATKKKSTKKAGAKKTGAKKSTKKRAAKKAKKTGAKKTGAKKASKRPSKKRKSTKR